MKKYLFRIALVSITVTTISLLAWLANKYIINSENLPVTYRLKEVLVDYKAEYDTPWGYRPAPNQVSISEKWLGEKLVYSATYEFDQYSRRVTPYFRSKNRDRFAVFFGGSHMFGEGLQEDQTLPYYFADALPFITPYNYGFRGYGPHHMLTHLRQKNFPEQIKEKDGYGIYLYLSDHVGRAAQTPFVISWSEGNQSYYTAENNGSLKWQPPLSTSNPTLVKSITKLAQSGLGKKTLLVANRSRFTKEQYDLTCKVILESRQRFLEHFPYSKFIVVLGLHTDKKDLTVDCLNSNGTRLIDIVELKKAHWNLPEMKIPYDGHPSDRWNQVLAEHLTQLNIFSETR